MSERVEPLAEKAAVRTVYRDGDRIRDTTGTGYHDHVSDGDIRRHMRENVADPGFMLFAKAVLAIRDFERAFSPDERSER